MEGRAVCKSLGMRLIVNVTVGACSIAELAVY